MRFAVLGPLEVSRDSGQLPLGGRKQRTLLALLLLHANRVVTRDELTDALWPERPPPSAAESLDTYVYRLRRLLGHDRLSRASGGYVLRVEPGELDVDEFEALVANASVAALTRALALWRGPPWADVVDLPLARAEAQRLEELRLAGIEVRIEAQLARGGGAELVPELERLVSEHPLHERLLASLMLALYRAGRQTDALDAFRSARRRLVEELGLEPGPQLHELQQRILQHDPALTPRRAPAPVRAVRRHRAIAVAAALVVAAGIGGLVLRAGATDQPPRLAAGDSGVVALNTESGRVATATTLGGAPSAMTTGAGSIWAANAGDATVLRIDPDTGDVVDRIPVGADPTSIAAGAGAVWVASAVGTTVLRIDPASDKVTQRIALGGANAHALAFGGGTVWVADSSASALYALDPATGAMRRKIALDGRPSALAFGADALWVADYHSATVLKVAAASGHVIASVRVGNGPDSLAFASGDLWVANRLDSTVSRIDPAAPAVRRTIAVPGSPSALRAVGGSVWVTSDQPPGVSRLDPRRDAAVSTVAVGGQPTSLTVAGGKLWLGVAARDAGHQGGTFVIAIAETFPTVDPAFNALTEPPAFMGLAYDTLVTFEHTGGTDGLHLVPDLALELPVATDGGRTYAFRIRRGIRYSDGVAVRAGDFRRALERLFVARSGAAGDYARIVGAAACAKRPARCDLARGIVVDDVRGTVVFHLTAPDPEFLYRLTVMATAPVPPSTPDHDTALDPIPGTGPYRIVRADRSGVRFARNPFFREWSHAAQPRGNPDAIEWRALPSPRAATLAVERGRADWFFGVPPLPEYRRLAIRSPSQLHSTRQFSVEFLPLNAHRAPFNRTPARKALNYAIDRRAIARMYGGAAFATPTCQPLAHGLPGYRRYCPYTAHPRADGAYGGPDLSHAKRLVARSGTRGEHVDVLGSADEGYVPPGVAPYVAHVLRSLGYRTTLHVVPFDSITPARAARFHLHTNGDWLADYPSPSSYLPPFFSCDGGQNNGFVCDPALDREMRRAQALELTDPGAANAAWTSIDHTLTDRADWVPTVNLRVVDLVSKRVRGYQFHPVWGFLVDQSEIQ